MYIISHTSRNSTLDYEQSIRKLNLGVNCLMYLPVHEQRRLAPAIRLAANDDLPSLRKKLRRDYAQFLIDYYELQEDPVQQRILESASLRTNTI